jgi:enoyl-CoA hydratase
MKDVTFENLLLTVADGILTITVNRPDKLNALNSATIEEIGEAVRDAAGDPAIEGIILTGAGSKAFVAGADIAAFTGLTVAEGQQLSARGQEVFKSIERCRKPVVAAVNGFALGGGCELAMSCHLRIASDTARFGQPEVKLGLIPGYGGTQRLVQLIGKTKALELLLTADMLSAADALRLGLVNDVVPADQLLPRCTELIKKISGVSPNAVAEVITTVDAYFDEKTDGFAEEVKAFGRCFDTADFREGVGAFLEKRKANFIRS